MVLVEGAKADGVIVDHDVFDITSSEGPANVAEHVVAAVLGTRESAETGGHHLKSIGVTWSDHAEATALRDALAARGIDDVMLVSEGHAAASLAQAVGRAVGYDTTALLFVDRDTATASVVRTDDGSVVKVLSRTLHSSDAMAVLTEMAEAVDTGAGQDAPPQGIFVVGAGVDITSVKAHLEHLVSLPIHAPDDAELALARGAGLASAAAPRFEATTVGLAYSQDPDGTTAGSVYAGLAGVETQLAAAATADEVVDEFAPTEMRPADEERKPFLLVGSALTSLFVVGVVALVISLAISIRPTADQRPSPAQSAIVPSSQAPAPAPAPAQQEAAIVPPAPPSAETIKPPVPVAREAPQQAPRTVFVEQAPAPAPAAPAPAPAPAAPPPPPVAPPPVVAPVVVPPPVIVLPRPQWTPPKPAWTWPKPRPVEPDEQQSPWQPPWQNDDDDEPQQPSPPTWTQVPQVPQPPKVPQVPTIPQWPDAGSGGGYGSGSGSGSSSGRGDGGSSRGGSGSKVPGDINGDGCFLVFCAPGGGRG
jgi:uncharacterized membrane protein YgcG